MRASRLLAMIITLQSKGSMTAQSFAERFEVSRRTIYRDLDELSAAGVPIRGLAVALRCTVALQCRRTCAALHGPCSSAASSIIVVYPDAFTRLPRLGASTVDAVMHAPAAPDGSRRATVAIEEDDAFAQEILGFGRSIQVVGPPALCARIAALADDLVRQYPAAQ